MLDFLCRAPKTVLDFFKPRAAGQLAGSSSQDGVKQQQRQQQQALSGAKRKASQALHEIHVNGGAGCKLFRRAGDLTQAATAHRFRDLLLTQITLRTTFAH